MKRLQLIRDANHYREAKRPPDARLFGIGEIVRFPKREANFAPGTVLRVAGVDGLGQMVRLRRKSGETVDWKPSPTAQVFSRAEGDVRRGTILEWISDQPELGIERNDLARVVEVEPGSGISIRSHKFGELELELDPGVWHYRITAEGAVGHLRATGPHRLEPFRDHDPVPEEPTHEESFDRIARPFSLTTHGSPPPLKTLSRGDLVYFAATRSEIPDNHAFVVSEIDHEQSRVHLVQGRELSARPERSDDVWWQPQPNDDVRVYKPARSIAAQDLVVWTRDDRNLLVRRGEYAEVVHVTPTGIAVTGVTSTPEVLTFDKERWSPTFHRENEAWHLSRVEGRTLERTHSRAVGEMTLAQ